MSDTVPVRRLPRTVGLPEFLRRYWHLATAILVIGVLFFVWWRYRAFTDVGYEPLQPIPFSHRLHAGELGMECQYCHFNAARGKHAGVPPTTVCLGCHDPAKGAAGVDKPGVQKLLALVGSLAEPAESYTGDQDLDGDDEPVVKVGGAVHWNRVHLLPDFAYFSHRWHVAAGIACQTCHGPVQEMEVVRQYADLTMGWCVECHRDNDYVGGPRYDGDPWSFTVGTANYDILRARIIPDEDPPFLPRPTEAHEEEFLRHWHVAAATDEDAPVPPGHEPIQKHLDEHGEHGDHGEQEDRNFLRGIFEEDLIDEISTREYLTRAQATALAEYFERFDPGPAGPSMPRWRIPELPGLHAELYNGGVPVPRDPAALREFTSYQNAPTQCSTCHQ